MTDATTQEAIAYYEEAAKRCDELVHWRRRDGNEEYLTTLFARQAAMHRVAIAALRKASHAD